MALENQVIIIQKGTSLPAGLRESLQSKGFVTRVSLTNEEAEKLIVDDIDNIFLLYCSPEVDPTQASNSIVEFKKFHHHPVIFIGKDADQFESFLNRHFVLATTLTHPCSSSDIVSAVEYVVRFVQKIKRTSRKQDAQPVSAELDAAHQLYRQFPTIPNLVFDQLIKLGILQKELGGGTYATTFRPDNLPQKPFMPSSEEYKKAIINIGDMVSDIKIGRMYRTGFLSDIFFRTLGISGLNLELARSAAFLFSSSFMIEHRDLYLNEFLSEGKAEFRLELCSKIKDSALVMSSEYNAPGLGRIVSLIGKLIGGEERASDNIEHMIASAIAGADMVDRVVYQRGVFQPVSAYAVLSKLKTTPVPYLHPIILGCIIKVLAEGVASKASNIAIDKRMRATRDMLSSADPIADLVLSPKEDAVALGSLTPGMKLSRPINTYDGKELLNDSMTLDQDLIWRLWQLAAIRPLSGPVVVISDTEVN